MKKIILSLSITSLLLSVFLPDASAQESCIPDCTPAASLYDALAGEFPWLNVVYDNAAPLSVPRIVLRGEFSTSGTAPLVLVDGVEMPLELLDPSVIGSVKVLRGGAAAAVYGARAAAGAIIITTVNSSPAAQTADMVSAAAYAGIDGNSSLAHNYNVTVRGGGSGLDYFFGGNYYGNADNFHKVGFTSNVNTRITKWLDYSLSLDYSYRKIVGLPGRDDVPATFTSTADRHYAMLRNKFTATLCEGLRLNLAYCFSNDYGFTRERDLEPNFYGEDRTRVSESDINAGIDFERTFSGVHHFRAAIGTDIQSGLHKRVGAAVGNLIDPSLSVLTIGDGKFDVGESKNNFFQCGIFLDAEYDFDSRYVAHITVREDGSSRFSPASRWATSLAASFKWNILENLNVHCDVSSVANMNIEPMFAYYASIDNNAGPAPFLTDRAALGRYSAYDFPVAENLRPERVSTAGIGADASLLDNRMDVNVELYARTVSDMINPDAVIGAMFGAAAPLMNQGRQSAFGADLALGWKDSCGDFNYSVTAMYSDHTRLALCPADLRHSYALNAGLVWKGLDFGVSFDGVGSMGIMCLRNVSAGYTIPLSRTVESRTLRVGIVSRNLYLTGPGCPMWIAAAVNFKF